MFTRHQLYQLYEEGPEPTIRLIESLLDYIEELRHDPHNRRQRHIADLSERTKKLQAKLKRVAEQLDRQLCLNSGLLRRIAELESAAVVKDSHNLRELTYVEESHPHQRGRWAEPLAGLLVEMKGAVEEARAALTE